MTTFESSARLVSELYSKSHISRPAYAGLSMIRELWHTGCDGVHPAGGIGQQRNVIKGTGLIA